MSVKHFSSSKISELSKKCGSSVEFINVFPKPCTLCF